MIREAQTLVDQARFESLMFGILCGVFCGFFWREVFEFVLAWW